MTLPVSPAALTRFPAHTSAPASAGDGQRPVPVTVVVIGAGQAGLSAAHHLLRRGFRQLTREETLGGPGPLAPPADHSTRVPSREHPGTFVVLDAEVGPGGAWRHRWQSLTMRTVNGIHELPGMAKIVPNPEEPSSAALTRIFGSYEREQTLAPIRPARVLSVSEESPLPHTQGTAGDSGSAPLLVRLALGGEEPVGAAETSAHEYVLSASGIINATGTWTRPFVPFVPGAAGFLGEQLHTAGYVSAEAFRGKRVGVVGGGISAVQFLDELSLVTETRWFTRREPDWRDAPFDREAGSRAVALVEDRVRAGLPPQSVVSVTGLIWTESLREAAARGALERLPMFPAAEEHGVRMPDGSYEPLDVLLWATGFRAALDHLAPLGLRAPGGGIVMDGTQTARDPRVHLVGYGPSSSTIGANRAGRAAVAAIVARLRALPLP